MKLVATSTGRNTVEEIENGTELVVQFVSIRSGEQQYMLEYIFQRGEEYARLTHLKYGHQEKTVVFVVFLDAHEFDELLASARAIASTNNPIDREAKIARFVEYIRLRYKEPEQGEQGRKEEEDEDEDPYAPYEW
jgi:hypothetical protein